MKRNSGGFGLIIRILFDASNREKKAITGVGRLSVFFFAFYSTSAACLLKEALTKISKPSSDKKSNRVLSNPVHSNEIRDVFRRFVLGAYG